jgi:hypothetical protein
MGVIIAATSAARLARTQRSTYIGVKKGSFGRRPKPGSALHAIQVISKSR